MSRFFLPYIPFYWSAAVGIHCCFTVVLGVAGQLCCEPFGQGSVRCLSPLSSLNPFVSTGLGLSVGPPSTWPLKSSKARAMAEPWTGGPWASSYLRCFRGEYWLPGRVRTRSPTRPPPAHVLGSVSPWRVCAGCRFLGYGSHLDFPALSLTEHPESAAGFLVRPEKQNGCHAWGHSLSCVSMSLFCQYDFLLCTVSLEPSTLPGGAYQHIRSNLGLGESDREERVSAFLKPQTGVEGHLAGHVFRSSTFVRG